MSKVNSEFVPQLIKKLILDLVDQVGKSSRERDRMGRFCKEVQSDSDR